MSRETGEVLHGKHNASDPGTMPRYQRTAMIGGTSGRSSKEANTNADARFLGVGA